jgi:cystathionine beta-lyase/cystathionine gamma-synthase
MLSIEDLAGIENVLASRPTRLVFFESPTNPATKVADVERIVDLAHRHGALAVMDNTFAGFHQHGEFGIDVFVHSLTKYAAGTGDVMGGAVIAGKDIIDGLRPDFSVLGAHLDPHAAFLIQRGLKTYFVRYSAQTANAMKVAEFLAAHPAVSRCHYPGLSTHPQYALARKQMKEPGTVVSFDLRDGSEAARSSARAQAVCAHREPRLHRVAGDAAATRRQPRLHTGAGEEVGRHPSTVRLSIGLEDVGDLIDDIDQALGCGEEKIREVIEPFGLSLSGGAHD